MSHILFLRQCNNIQSSVLCWLLLRSLRGLFEWQHFIHPVGLIHKNGYVWEPTQRGKDSFDCTGPTRWGITSRILGKENSSSSWKRSWGGWDIQSLSSSPFSEVPKFTVYLIFPRIWSLFSPNAFWPSKGIHKRISVFFIMCGWHMKSRMLFCVSSAYKILDLKKIAVFWNVSMCSLVERRPSFIGICSLQITIHEEASRFLWHVCKTEHTSGSRLRIQHSEYSCSKELKSEVTRRFPTVSLFYTAGIFTHLNIIIFSNSAFACCFWNSLEGHPHPKHKKRKTALG